MYRFISQYLKRYLTLFVMLLFLLWASAACAPINAERAISNLQNPAAQETAVAFVEPVGTDGAVRDAAATLSDGTVISYTVILPPDYQVGQPYPTLLAMPPGSQTASMVESGLNSYWRDGALANGWVVISPIAPNGELFFQGAERFVPEFLNQMAAQYPPEGEKFYLTGVSNGGISAFRIAGANPDRFQSLMVLPGYPITAEDKANLAQLTTIPVALFVGENDTSWIAPMREAAAMLNNAGGDATLTVVPGEGHFIRSLSGGEQLFALLESYRRGAQ